jgi:hypothetical protein
MIGPDYAKDKKHAISIVNGRNNSVSPVLGESLCVYRAAL